MLTSEVGVVCEGQEDRLISKQTNSIDVSSASRKPGAGARWWALSNISAYWKEMECTLAILPIWRSADDWIKASATVLVAVTVTKNYDQNIS